MRAGWGGGGCWLWPNSVAMCMYSISYEQTGGNSIATALINHWHVALGPSHLDNRDTGRLLDPAASDAQPHKSPVSPYRLPLTTVQIS